MDLISSCKDKLVHFRIKELKVVLTQLGCSKQGKKQDLIDRILSVLCDEQGSSSLSKKNAVEKEEVARLVDDIYRKLPATGATDLASKSKASPSDKKGMKLKEEVEDTYEMERIRCPCGSSLQTDSMIKCEDPRCHVWQHISCVLIPDKPTDGVIPATPDTFYCEICRLNRGDPFLLSVAHPLYPVKLITTSIPTDGSNPMLGVEKTFQLTRADKDLLKQEYDVQAWCMLLNDKVPFRMHWPQYADLYINDVSMRTINRPGSQLLGVNGRDDGPIITKCTRDGINKISLTGCDTRPFCLGIRLIKRRTFEQILNMIPKESDGEKFDDALARVRRCVGGGNATGNDNDSDSDLEVVADCISVNLRCPMSGSRMKVAGRFKPCLHMGCFDLEVFLMMTERSRKWQCPICLKNYCLDKVIIDPYFSRITSKMRNCGEDVTDIEVKPDGSWRAKSETDLRELGDIGLWHFPDGSLCPTVDSQVKPKSEILKLIKQEGGGSDGHTSLKLGIRKSPNGVWKVSKQEDLLQEKFENHHLNIIPMSSSATESGRDGEDQSVTGGGNFDGMEHDSVSLNLENRFSFPNQNHPPLGDQEVIVLSDSEEENDILPGLTNAYTNNIDGSSSMFPVSHGIPEPYLGLFNTVTDDDFGTWSMPSGGQAGSSFQLFSSEADVSNAMMNGYNLNPEADVDPAGLVHDSMIDLPNADMNGGLVDNPLAFGGNDPALQIFLPTRPSSDTSSVQANVRNQPDASSNIRSDNWISLRVGDSGIGNNGNNCNVTNITNGLSSQQRLQSSKEGSLSSLAETATSFKTLKERSDSPFTFPRQKRSVRPRLYLSIDTDSE
ncbi:E3 SUMO-protein ligase SIZ1-like [Impatiens glandulifera]|uniref:E3 SUMO-protein ligase SIZ1-like n=1 Tax=Impatiens glandulifera TaxID=253017 RepID=UPI001FB0F98A|nr:E3 SUMO-protein ligase SIZ1-like [Impatiens glandulifera]XP_047319847.1 E3 SUMO-protein ligase SIZ1-like [Impatiens glandulifera]